MSAPVAVIGNLDIDLLLGPMERGPVFGQEMFVSERVMRPGGQAFNTAAALGALGTPPVLISDVGDDALGEQITAALGEAGVDSTGVSTVPLPTAITVALLDQHRDRAFISHLGHLSALNAESVFERWSDIEDSSFLLYAGHFCMPGLWPDGGMRLLERAKKEGMTTLLDTGWDPGDWRSGGREEVRAMLRHTDIFLPNLEEARALTGLEDPADAARTLLGWGTQTVVVTMGGGGVLSISGETCLRVPALPVEVYDTVGAGDSFNAGLLHALNSGQTWNEALQMGIAVAAYAIGEHDPRYPTEIQLREATG